MNIYLQILKVNHLMPIAAAQYKGPPPDAHPTGTVTVMVAGTGAWGGVLPSIRQPAFLTHLRFPFKYDAPKHRWWPTFSLSTHTSVSILPVSFTSRRLASIVIVQKFEIEI
ncbi:hypothetical protein AVEN_127033-1 [Araneus ventricosus]|uniref:Uncharacterized protein n=1 Tax=Araneus ventricosus TaxID=182803 RepID=A0A4Y2C1G5_ARAVE|nr:hypothetical protein AVEN_127033-1 [Araneus ventricosus]